MASGEYYVTTQGDCWDSLAYDIYGSESYMKLLIEANWELLDYLVFPSGIEIFAPDLPEVTDEDAPFWRQDDEEDEYFDEEDEYFSSVEYPDDEEDADE